jgi:hypothetical protein
MFRIVVIPLCANWQLCANGWLLTPQRMAKFCGASTLSRRLSTAPPAMRQP